MINIELSKDYRLLSDKHNFILARVERDRIFHEGFYSSIENAINEFIQRKIRLSNSNSIHSLIEYIKSLETALNKALLPLKLEVVSIK